MIFKYQLENGKVQTRNAFSVYLFVVFMEWGMTECFLIYIGMKVSVKSHNMSVAWISELIMVSGHGPAVTVLGFDKITDSKPLIGDIS